MIARAAMADVAAVFHWPPQVMREMEWDELLEWRALAKERLGVADTGGR